MKSPQHKAMLPLIICGHGSSGTTLLTSLLDGHSQINVLPEETWYLEKANTTRMTSTEAFLWLLSENKRKILARKLAAGGDYIDGQDYSYETLADKVLPQLQNSSAGGQVLSFLANAYSQQVNKTGAKYWAEKTPGNEHFLFQASKWAEFKEMHAIYIIRDPRDVYLSYTKKMSNVKKPNSMERFICRWGFSVLSWKHFSSRHPHCMTIRYEDLVQNPSQVLNSVCNFLGIDFESILLKPTKHGKTWPGNSLHSDTFSAISSAPIGRWVSQISHDDLIILETYLGKIMTHYAYSLSLEPISTRHFPHLIFRQKEKHMETMRMLFNQYFEFGYLRKFKPEYTYLP